MPSWLWYVLYAIAIALIVMAVLRYAGALSLPGDRAPADGHVDDAGNAPDDATSPPRSLARSAAPPPVFAGPAPDGDRVQSGPPQRRYANASVTPSSGARPPPAASAARRDGDVTGTATGPAAPKRASAAPPAAAGQTANETSWPNTPKPGLKRSAAPPPAQAAWSSPQGESKAKRPSGKE